MNDHSSRRYYSLSFSVLNHISHTIFQLFVERRAIQADGADGASVRAKLNLVCSPSVPHVSELTSFCRWILLDQRSGRRRTWAAEWARRGSRRWCLSTRVCPHLVYLYHTFLQHLWCGKNCIAAVLQSGRTHVPFRDSKLTRLLQDRYITD